MQPRMGQPPRHANNRCGIDETVCARSQDQDRNREFRDHAIVGEVAGRLQRLSHPVPAWRAECDVAAMIAPP